MKVLINAVSAKMGGALRHLRGFLKTLGEMDQEREYWVYLNSDVKVPSVSSNIHISYTSFPSVSFLHRLYFDQILIPSFVKKHGIDILLSLLNFGPIKSPVNQVVFQRNSTYFCDYYLQMSSGWGKVETLLLRWVTYKVMRSSEIIVTPTYAMRDMIRKIYPGLPKDKFQIIPHGFDYQDFLENSQPLPEDTEKHFKENSNGYIKLLYASHPARYRGADILFDSIRLLKETTDKVCLYIPIDSVKGVNRDKGIKGYDESARRYISLIRDFNIRDKIVCVGWVPSESIVNLYKGCDIFVFPSLCESFGYPMVEAMAAGLPIVAADTPVNREVLHDSALFYSPLSSRDLTESIKMLMKDNDLREKLIKNGKKRIEGYDWGWKRYIRDVLNILEELEG
jgi:glycosyltransferase involved in cell wall biosynthesis